MLKLLILVSAVACALGAAVPKGMVPHLDGRIIGGVDTTISAHPWQVSVQRSGSHNCGGSIYSGNIIITAAHCLQYVTSSVLSVRAGSTEWNTGGTLISVSTFRVNFDYNYYTFEYDIGLIKLESSLTMSSTIRPIALATVAPPDGAAAVVTGWGTLAYGDSTLPTTLQAVDVNIISQKTCASNSFGYGYKEVMYTMICAAASGKDACQGDSGGPLVSGGVLVGVVSWGFGCANAFFPGVYTSIATVQSWIVSTATTLS